MIIDQPFINDLRTILKQGWIKNTRVGNHGSVGNILEDVLGVPENNLPLPDIKNWELKSKRENSSSLTTLIHIEPFPRKSKIVPSILLPMYGWKHSEAGIKYPSTEMSFRQTINSLGRSDRGFKVVVDRENEKVLISFDSSAVASHHHEWLEHVRRNAGLEELNPQPYWDFDSLAERIPTKLKNCCFAQALTKVENGIEYFKYNSFEFFVGFNFENFILGLENGAIYADFDARTGHNHGTKFRIKKNYLTSLYEEEIKVL